VSLAIGRYIPARRLRFLGYARNGQVRRLVITIPGLLSHEWSQILFTGLVEEIGEVRRLSRGTVARLVVASSRVIDDVSVGDSVSVDGVCLTVTGLGGGEISFDAVPETLARSTLKDSRSGDKVNLEASLRAGKMIGGHFVQGHVDGVGTLEEIKTLAESRCSRSKPRRK